MEGVEWGVNQNLVLLRVSRTRDFQRILFRRQVELMEPPVDPEAFTTFELRFRGDEVQALLGGRSIMAFRRSFRRHACRLGVMVNSAKGEYRNVEVRQR